MFSAQGALWIIAREGGEARRITDYRIEPTAPVWSPDGKRIAFQNYAPEGNFHIWSIAPDGSGLVFSPDRHFDDVGLRQVKGISAPAQTPEQLAAQEKLCRDEPHHCGESGGHAH